MSQVTQTFRVGADIDEITHLIEDNAMDIFGVGLEEGDEAEWSRIWSTHEVRQGRLQVTPEEPGSAIIRMVVTTGPGADPEEIMGGIAERLGGVLPDGDGLERPAIVLEPEPGAPPEAETSEDQPL